VSPNPLVGCVVVSSDGEVVGEGTYIRDDVVHAEAIALQQAGERARGGTAYVSLEPHDHQSRTPPCTEVLIDAGITRLVCPIEDPNPLVSGNGFERLRASGIEVITGILAAEAERLNEKFICWHKKGRPFVHLKLAISLDGRISLDNSVTTALSGEEAIRRVHAFRHEYDAILIGGNTASVDDPVLTDRSDKPRRRPLVRVILDNRLRVSTDSKLAATAGEFPTIVFSNSTDEEKVEALFQRGIQVPRIDARDLRAVLAELKQRDVQSVLVEGGTQVAGAFCDSKLVDKVTLIAAPMIIGGSSAPVAIGGRGADSTAAAMHLKDVEITRLAEDIEITGYPEWRAE
jgi:diaminohydroxyphosphoribosylaminopyrimidine deaminase/5-amino-6-(5-phosphoribosylamino)uracil reductase